MGWKKIAPFFILLLIINSNYINTIQAVDDEEEPGPILATYFDILLTLFSSGLALVLLLISVIAYRQDQRVRLLFVMGAFALFALKGTVIALDDLAVKGFTFGLSQQSINILNSIREPVSRLLDMGILLLFFMGLLKK